jgi:hypothetical protein
VLPDERSRKAIEIAERYLDGQARVEELHLAAGLHTSPTGTLASRAAVSVGVQILRPSE